jgi:hypothetical protein
MKLKLTAIIIIVICLLFSLGGCGQSESSDGKIIDNVRDIIEDDVTPTKYTHNRIQFDMDLEGGKMNVMADYVNEEVAGQSFVLNKKFEVTEILCDGEKINIDEVKETVILSEENSEFGYHYEIHCYNLPSFETIHIEYIGIMDGTTGIFPDQKSIELAKPDTISPEFTFLRYETIFHPLFFDPEDTENAQGKPFNLRVTINVPDGYTAAFPYMTSEEASTAAGKSFTADFNYSYADIAASIAKYQKIETTYADFYLLENTGMDISWVTETSTPTEKEIVEIYLRSNFLYDRLWEKFYIHEHVNIIEIPPLIHTGLSDDAITNHTFADVQSIADYIRTNDLLLFQSFTDAQSFKNYVYNKQAKLILNLAEDADIKPLSFPKFNGDSYSMLVVGNSFIYPMSNPLEAIAGEYGINLKCTTIAAPGASLASLMARALDAIKVNKYDFLLVKNYLYELEDLKILFNAAKEKGTAPVLFYAGDGRQSFVDTDGKIKPDAYLRQWEAIISEVFAKSFDAVFANAGQARVYAYEKVPDISLFEDDHDRHSNTAGVYHNVCVVLSTLFDLQVTDIIETNNSNEYTNDAAALGQAAWEYVSWYKEHQNTLK